MVYSNYNIKVMFGGIDMSIIKLDHQHHNQLKNLIATIKKDIDPNKLIIIPQDQIETIFNNNTTIIYGVVEQNNLLAMSGLFWDESDYLDIKRILNIQNSKVAEIAECLVLPNARGNNYMLKLNQCLLEEAKKLGFEYVIATAHPQNYASHKSLIKLGMTTNKQFNRYDKYLRNIYYIKL